VRTEDLQKCAQEVYERWSMAHTGAALPWTWNTLAEPERAFWVGIVEMVANQVPSVAYRLAEPGMPSSKQERDQIRETECIINTIHATVRDTEKPVWPDGDLVKLATNVLSDSDINVERRQELLHTAAVAIVRLVQQDSNMRWAKAQTDILHEDKYVNVKQAFTWVKGRAVPVSLPERSSS